MNADNLTIMSWNAGGMSNKTQIQKKIEIQQLFRKCMPKIVAIQEVRFLANQKFFAGRKIAINSVMPSLHRGGVLIAYDEKHLTLNSTHVESLGRLVNAKFTNKNNLKFSIYNLYNATSSDPIEQRNILGRLKRLWASDTTQYKLALGDFNLPYSFILNEGDQANNLAHSMGDQDFQDVFASLGEIGHTWRGKGERIEQKSRVDYVFSNQKFLDDFFTFLEPKIFPVCSSDHAILFLDSTPPLLVEWSRIHRGNSKKSRIHFY